MSESPSPKPYRKRWIAGISLLVLLIIAGAVTHTQRSRISADQSDQLTFAVRRGPLVISLTESGTIESQNKIIIKNQISGSTTILWIIDEGTQVKAGELLVRLDAKQLEDQLFTQQIKVQNNEALFVNSRETLAITKNEAASNIEQAETTLTFAEQDLKQHIEGEYPQQLRETEASITLAEEDLQRSEDKLKWSQILVEKQFISQTEYQADELAAKKARLDIELARGKKHLLETYTNTRALAELKSNLKQAKMALERVQRKARANILKAEADFAAKEAEYKRQQDKLEEIEVEIKETEVRAPSAGQVVYATSAQSGHRRSSSEPLAEGRAVRAQEALIHLPDPTKMMASIKVHETHVKGITIDMPAKLSVDALPNVEFNGHVTRVAPLPDANSFWLNPNLKVYTTDVYIDKNSKGLRNGMTCEVEIIAEAHDDVLYIPIQSVVRIKGHPTAFVVNKKGLSEPRKIEAGADNGRMIHVLNGLLEGEKVLLSPPLEDSDRDKRENFAAPEDDAQKRKARRDPKHQ
jgi:HlyD family secretion protein